MPPVAATPAMQYNGQTPRDAYMRPLQTCRQICTTRKTAGRAIKNIAPRFYGKTKTRRPLPRLVFHKKKEKNRTSCRFLQRNGTHPSTSRCPSFRPGRALWYSSSLSTAGIFFVPVLSFDAYIVHDFCRNCKRLRCTMCCKIYVYFCATCPMF